MKNRIRELREAMGLTQEQLGVLVGASRQAINALEMEKNEPSIWLAHDIAEIFHEPIEQVFLFEESARRVRPHGNRREQGGGEADQEI